MLGGGRLLLRQLLEGKILNRQRVAAFFVEADRSRGQQLRSALILLESAFAGFVALSVCLLSLNRVIHQQRRRNAPDSAHRLKVCRTILSTA